MVAVESFANGVSFAAAMSTMAVPSSACSQAPLGQDCCCCKRCGMGGCDLKVMECGCCLHARCCPISEQELLIVCPVCHSPARIIRLLPMAFDEIDAAQAEAAQTELSAKRGKKRKNATITRLQPKKKAEDNESPDLRTGRWTPEETAYCDKLIELFESGKLPLPDGFKLNDFLAGMLKSKQARLTKKMKNAKLSTRQYKRNEGYIASDEEARLFSQLETNFFASIRCNMERSEIRFHMQKVWRELFSNYCVSLGQKLDADDWLRSVEEMDRRASVQKDAARMARRKIMMGYALSQDSINPQHGVFIDPSSTTDARSSQSIVSVPSSDFKAKDGSDGSIMSSKSSKKLKLNSPKYRPPSSYTSPFLGRVIQFVQRHGLPFEHCDAWVPSLVPVDGMGAATPSSNNGQCRLCFAGCATADVQIPNGGGNAVVMSQDDQFDLVSFGFYSQKFSFDVGCGLPGRVYNSGVPSWEQGIDKAPAEQFERAGGAKQWCIQTVLGVPIASPNVGRIVVVLYSRFDRPRDSTTVGRIVEELTRLMPSPQWKLIVDVGVPQEKPSDSQEAHRIRELLSLIQAHAPEDKNSPLAEFLPGFTSLRLLLVEHMRSDREDELLKSALEVFKAYKSAGRPDRDAIWMTARDFMTISKHEVAHVVGGSSEGSSLGSSAGGRSANLAQHPSRTHSAAASRPGATLGSARPVASSSNVQYEQNDAEFPLGLSPGLHPIPGNWQQTDLLSNLAPLSLAANQLSSVTQSNIPMNLGGGVRDASI